MNDIETRLKRLQPDPGTLNRDELLYHAAFAAGKRAGSSRIPWRAVCGFLVVTQIGTLLWLDKALAPKAVFQTTETVPTRLPQHEPPASVSPEPTSYIALMQHLGEDAKPIGGGTAIEPQPPLTPRSPID